MKDADPRIERYFAGDLDRVEASELEADLEANPALRVRFEEIYDARTETLGLLALEARDPELDECFAPTTLERHAQGKLTGEAASMVEAHLACPLCREHFEGFRAQATGAARRATVRSRGPRWHLKSLTAAVSAIALVLAVIVFTDDGPDPDALRGLRVGDVEVALSLPKGRQVADPPVGLEVSPGREAEIRLSNGGQRPRYLAIAVRAAGELRHVVPPPGAGELPRNLTVLEPGVRHEVPIDVSLAGSVVLYVLVSDVRHSTLELGGAFVATETGVRRLGLDGRPTVWALHIESRGNEP